MSITSQQALDVFKQAQQLYTQAQAEAALTRMAGAITARLSESNPVVLCVMTGAVIPAGQLLTQLEFPLQLDYVHATRYRGQTQGGELHWLVKPVCDLHARAVLIIDDILDEGFTLAAIVDYCRAQGAHTVYTAVLVDKLHDRKHGLRADFVGLEVEDRYVFGYGMDYKGYLRNVAGIYAVTPGSE